MGQGGILPVRRYVTLVPTTSRLAIADFRKQIVPPGDATNVTQFALLRPGPSRMGDVWRFRLERCGTNGTTGEGWNESEGWCSNHCQ